MNPARPRRTRLASRLPLQLLPVLATLAVTLVMAPSTLAYSSYVHGDVTAVGCSACHTDNHTNWPVGSEMCLSCHTGYRVPESPAACWTCHTPGQDMDWARSDAAYARPVHDPTQRVSAGPAHLEFAEHDRELAGEGILPLLADLVNGLVETKSGFDTDRQQVERVRHRPEDLLLPSLHLAPEPHRRKQEAKSAECPREQQSHRRTPGLADDEPHEPQPDRQQRPGAEELLDADATGAASYDQILADLLDLA